MRCVREVHQLHECTYGSASDSKWSDATAGDSVNTLANSSPEGAYGLSSVWSTVELWGNGDRMPHGDSAK
jgi:hypothetical protein